MYAALAAHLDMMKLQDVVIAEYSAKDAGV
jgi:hypothetical protein